MPNTAQKIVKAIPLPDRVVKIGAFCSALVAIAGAWIFFGGPTPVMKNSDEIFSIETQMDVINDAVKEQRQDVDAHREEFLSRAIRDDKRELYTVINRMAEDGSNPDLIEQKIVIEESIEEMETERDQIRKKKGD